MGPLGVRALVEDERRGAMRPKLSIAVGSHRSNNMETPTISLRRGLTQLRRCHRSTRTTIIKKVKARIAQNIFSSPQRRPRRYEGPAIWPLPDFDGARGAGGGRNAAVARSSVISANAARPASVSR